MDKQLIIDFFNLLKRAIEDVDVTYFKATTHLETTQYTERAFCYELYHQLRSKQENEKSLDGWLINGEIPKMLGICNGETSIGGMSIMLNYEKDQKRVTPDMVIHKSQSVKTEGNCLVLEVKNSPQKVDIQWDLYKLMKYIEEFKYGHGVYLQVNKDFNKLKEEIKALFSAVNETDHKNLLEKISIITVCLTKQGKEKTKNIKRKSLWEIINCGNV